MAACNTVSRRNLLKWGAAAVGVGVFLPVLAACSDDDKSAAVETDAAKLPDAAKSEGKLSLYSSASTGPSNAIAEGFKAKYGVGVEVYRAGSSEVASRIESEEQARRTQADVLIIEEPALTQVRKYLAEYTVVSAAAIDAAYKSPTATLIRMYAAQLGWNTGKISEADAPKDWADLLDSKWSGRLGLLDPHTSATTLAWQDLVQKQYGDDYLAKLGANKPKQYASTNAMTQAIISGEIDLGVVNSFGVLQLAETGAPIGGVMPKVTVLFGGNVSVFKNAPHPNAARLFAEYACSPEGQTLINDAGFTIPTHPDSGAKKAGTLADLGKDRTFSQPDFAKIIADTEKMLEVWDKNIK